MLLRDAFIIFYSKIDRVRELDLSGNRLSSTEFLQSSKFNILEDLRLSENYLNSTFSATHSHFSNLTSLTHLYLSNSQLNNLNFLYDSSRVTSHLRSLKVSASVPVRSDYSRKNCPCRANQYLTSNDNKIHESVSCRVFSSKLTFSKLHITNNVVQDVTLFIVSIVSRQSSGRSTQMRLCSGVCHKNFSLQSKQILFLCGTMF